MGIVSYAQNLEDVMLWRALQEVEGGFYLDVGAQDPVIDSVTRAFYDRGWCGVNLEPAPAYHAALAAARPPPGMPPPPAGPPPPAQSG